MHDERFTRGIREFNERRFFEAHDVLEELWHEYREDDRLFLQGLIQVAVGYYHLENRNYNGCRSQFAKAMSKLEPYQPNYHGVNVSELLSTMRRCIEAIRNAVQREEVQIPPDLISKIHHPSLDEDRFVRNSPP